MPDFDKMLSQDPFGMPQSEKDEWYCELQKELTLFHYQRCAPYKNIIDRFLAKPDKNSSISDMPFLPARLFKSFDMKSTDYKEISRVLTSSGTSGKAVSRIHLDRKAIFLQSRVLKHIFFWNFSSTKRYHNVCYRKNQNIFAVKRVFRHLLLQFVASRSSLRKSLQS